LTVDLNVTEKEVGDIISIFFILGSWDGER